MKKPILSVLVPLVMGYVFLIGSAQETGVEEYDVLKFLPTTHELPGWKMHRPVLHYQGEGLYEYINGGAEIYHEYGFIGVVVQDYISQAGKTVSVEIFEMEDAESAFGMYSFKTDAEGKAIALGQEAQLAPYYMNFWKGPFLVTLTGFDDTEKTIQGLVTIAQEVDKKIEVRGKKPSLVNLLPPENMIPQSLKYFEGPLGLMNSAPFFSIDMRGFEGGVKGDYTGGYSFFLIRYKGREECLASYEYMKNVYGKFPNGQEGDFSGTRFIRLKDKRGRLIYVFVYRDNLVLLGGKLDPAQAVKIFRGLHFQIDSPG